MRTKLLAATAVAGSLAMASLIWGSAQATPVPTATQAPNKGIVTLVGHQGGGGHGHGGGMRAAGGGGGPNLGAGSRHGGRAFAEGGGPRSYAGRDLHRSGPKGDIRHGNAQAFNRDRDHGDRNHGDRNRRFAERDHDRNHDFDHRGRHRVFRNGIWVWIYGPDYYSYNDCWWLRERALATGNPYWWSRYNYCVGYY
jgi:hypothetical protein